MQLVRDLIRDLVGILFPGGLVIVFTLWAAYAILIILDPSTPFKLLPTDNNFLILILFSYIVGQSLRIKRLEELEEHCTQEYRRKRLPEMDHSEWEKFVQKIKEEEKKYYEGSSSLEQLKDLYREYVDQFKFWEKFPYGYRLRGRRLLHQPEEYIKFYEKYDKQGITNYDTFFNLCKSVVIEYSPSFKEEMLRQESLVRLFAGIYYVIKFGKILSLIVGSLHLLLATLITTHLKIGFIQYENVQLSVEIFLASLFAFLIFLYMNSEILKRLRNMRVREVNMAYDAFYIISKKNDLNL